ncbi:glycosyltransferase family 4 protein [Photobacterium swingsii]|uniref:glycosyltransferase family 4 protein n=1 Tax=Photobacterium swingsii TaxID=680026 RepID=UPI0040687C24
MKVRDKLYLAHLYDDHSGSPKVLSHLIESVKDSYDCIALLGSSSSGFISETGVVKKSFFYSRSSNKLMTLVVYLISQLHLFFICCGFFFSDKVRRVKGRLVVNTILPFGAALAAKIFGVTVVYYCHEVSIKPKALSSFLNWVRSLTSKNNIFVSNFIREEIGGKGVNNVVYNALDFSFYETNATDVDLRSKWRGKKVTMACSLKKYKGVDEFVSLAKCCSELNFCLIINDSQESVNKYFNSQVLPMNLTVVCKPSNIIQYYRESFITLNLSIPEQWTETFGLTLIEAMSQFTPVVSPPVGGPTEFVVDNYNGFMIRSDQISLISEKLNELSHNYDLWKELSNNAKKTSDLFSPAKYKESINTILAG